MNAQKYLKIRFEEVILGMLLGAAVGLALAVPFIAPLETLNPLGPSTSTLVSFKTTVADGMMLLGALCGGSGIASGARLETSWAAVLSMTMPIWRSAFATSCV